MFFSILSQRKKKVYKNGARYYAPQRKELFLAEGLAVSTLVHGGIALVGAYQNTVQSAVVLVLTMVCTLMNGTFNTLVGVAIHI